MEILSVITSLLGLASQAGAQADQRNLDWANLFETKRTNRKNEQLATSSRKDAYGNEVYYDPVFGWQIKSTPMTKGILDAEQSETLKSLTEDAGRNRNAAVRRDDRSKMADEEFEKQFNNYKYKPRPTEAEFIADATGEATLAQKLASDSAAAMTNRALMRQGNTSNVPAVFNAARDAEAKNFTQTLLGGKRQGRQDYQNYLAADDGADQQELGFLEGLASGTTSMPQRFTNMNAELGNEAQGALDRLMQTLSLGDASRSAAMGRVSQSAGQSPDFSQLAALFKSLGNEGKQAVTGSVSSDIPYPRPYEEGVRARLRAGF